MSELHFIIMHLIKVMTSAFFLFPSKRASLIFLLFHTKYIRVWNTMQVNKDLLF